MLMLSASSETEGYSGDVTVVVDIRWNVTTLQQKTKVFTYVNGVVTTVGAESAWTNIVTT